MSVDVPTTVGAVCARRLFVSDVSSIRGLTGVLAASFPADTPAYVSMLLAAAPRTRVGDVYVCGNGEVCHVLYRAISSVASCAAVEVDMGALCRRWGVGRTALLSFLTPSRIETGGVYVTRAGHLRRKTPLMAVNWAELLCAIEESGSEGVDICHIFAEYAGSHLDLYAHLDAVFMHSNRVWAISSIGLFVPGAKERWLDSAAAL